MATEVLKRRGTTAEHSTFTGGAGEVTVDTDKNTVVVHDGVTAGGHPLAKAAELLSSDSVGNDELKSTYDAVDQGSWSIAANDGTFVPPAGWYMCAADNSVKLELYVNGAWEDSGGTGQAFAGLMVFDGTNARFLNQNSSQAKEVYYRRLA